MSADNTGPFAAFGRKRRLHRVICDERARLYRIAWSWCHDSHTADDLVQETLTKAMSRLDSLRDENRLPVWLTQIMANLFRDQFRRIAPDTGLESDTLAGGDCPEDAANRSQLIARTRDAISGLSADQRQVLTLIDVAGFSYAETASILGVPVGTVMSRLSRARRRMRESFEQQGIGRADVIPLRKPR